MIEIKGAGSSKKPKTQRPPIESPNTLQSASKGQILDLLAFGPIKGLVNGMQSIFLDDTPLQNDDGTFNFEGITVDGRWGDPNQDVIPGFKDISNPREINAEVTYDAPIVRSLLNNDVDAIIVSVRLSALVLTDTATGDTKPSELPFAIHVRNGDGVWNTGVADVIRGKTTSPYERSYRIELQGSGPFSVRVQRGNLESDSNTHQDQLSWAYLTEVIDTKQSYPGCALAGIEVDAKLFGNSIPSRKYLLDLSIIKVPSNYDPVTRNYSGIWDGTFKDAWSDNPAWCFYDLATNPIIGAGIREVNKWSLYEIGRYCDESVPDGFGGFEPRFTCNTVFSAQEDAIVALSTLASVFRGMLYWGGGVVEPVADMPGPVRRILSPSDVIGGEFSYSGTALKERHSVAVVMWNDPEDGYESKPEMVEDAEQLELLGWRELRITSVACTSRGQARRLGLWALYSEKMETQTVSFTVPVKQFDMRPGEFFGVNDPYRSGARLGGKVKAVAGRVLTLDAVPTEVTSGWKITLETGDGGLQQFTITMVVGDNVTVNSAPTVDIGSGFALSSSAVVARIFRVAAVSEQEGSVFSITATEHDPTKYDQVEKGLKLPPPPTSLIPSGRLLSPRNLTATPYTYVAGGTEHQGMTISWTPPDDARVDHFVVDVKGPSDVAFRTVYRESGISFDLPDVESGVWAIRARSSSLEWGNSAWVEKQLVVTSLLQPSPPDSLYFTTTSNSISILPSTTKFGLEFEFWRSASPLQPEFIETNATYLGTGSFFVDVPLSFDTVYYYFVRGINIYGKSSWVMGSARTDANVDEILDIILQEQQESAVGKWFQEEIQKISGVGVGSVNDRIGVVDTRLDLTISDLEAVNGTLQQEIDFIQTQLVAFTEAEFWDPLLPYQEFSIVQHEGKLYSAVTDVDAGVEPPNEEFWRKIGDFSSLSGAITDLAIRIETSETRVDVIGGIVTPMASQLSSLKAMWDEQEEDEDGQLEGALRQWEAKAEFDEEVIVRASETEALSQRLTVLSASLGDMGSSIGDLEQALVTETEALAQRITRLKVDAGSDLTAAIQAEQLVRATEDLALAQEIVRLEAVVEDDIRASIAQETLVRADEDEALGLRIDRVSSDFGDSESLIHEELTTLASADLALGSRIDVTQASVGDNTALIEAETIARVNDVSSVASQVTGLKARWDEQEEDEDGVLDSALSAWRANSEFYQEVKIRALADLASAQRITLLGTSLDDLSSSVVVMEQSLTTDIEAVATSVTRLKADVGDDISSAIQRESTARASKDEALSQDILDLRATMEVEVGEEVQQLSAALNVERTARADGDVALAQELTSLQATVEVEVGEEVRLLDAAITAERLARTTKDEALSQEISTLYTSFGSELDGEVVKLEAALRDERTVRSNADGSLSSRINTAQSTANGASVSAQQAMSTASSVNGKVNATWGVKLQVNNKGQYVTTGIGLGLDNYGGVIQSNFIVQANNFTVITGLHGVAEAPFAVQGSRTIIKSAFIGDASISMLKIGGDLYSDNFRAATSWTPGLGWRLQRSGLFEINSPLPGGGRVELNNKGMRVYDEAGRIRVKIGDLR